MGAVGAAVPASDVFVQRPGTVDEGVRTNQTARAKGKPGDNRSARQEPLPQAMEAQWKKSCLVRRHPTSDCSALGCHPGRSDQGVPCQVGSGQLPVSLVNGPAAEEHSIAGGVRRAIGDSRVHQLSGHGHGRGHDPAEAAGWLKMGNPTGFAQGQLVLGFVILRGGLVSF